jgi:hypothetical protein
MHLGDGGAEAEKVVNNVFIRDPAFLNHFQNPLELGSTKGGNLVHDDSRYVVILY